MSVLKHYGVGGLDTKERLFIIGTVIWLFLQMSRFIAFVLIADINQNTASEAWRYPAYLDLFAAIFALPLMWCCLGATWAYYLGHYSFVLGNFDC